MTQANESRVHLRGFGSLDQKRRREIAASGGIAAREKGTAHRWTSEEAAVAGKIGGSASKGRKLKLDSDDD